jgi:type IV secretory pathway VirD2 relaxase
VVIKARVIRHQGTRYRAAPMAVHLRYLRREGVSRDGAPAEMFDRNGPADHDAFAARTEDDRHHFRFIVSPEDAEQLQDLRATTRDLMARAERDLGTRLDWVAVDHWNTDNPHLHVLVRGVTDDGPDLVISRDYISRGFREQAEALVSLELGPRTEAEIAASLDREVNAGRWTSLDRRLRDLADAGMGDIDLRALGGRHVAGEGRLIGRAQHLERLGLARSERVGRWTLASDLEPQLRALGERGDIIKSLHRAMQGRERDPASIMIEGAELGEPVFGKLVERGLHDELSGRAYAVVDGVDGRLHHFRFSDLGETGDTPLGGLVEIRMRVANGAPPRLETVHRSDLGVAAQVHASGATWLDRQLVVREPQALAHSGFGAEVRDALEQRRAQLEAMGLARRQGGGVVLAKDLIATLRRRELARVSANIAGDTGAAYAEALPGDRIGGIYRRRLALASGRFAMIDDGLGFQLVPWTRSLDARLGQEVRGAMSPGGGVDWAFGRKRGIGL